jgi:hypothetical protein
MSIRAATLVVMSKGLPPPVVGSGEFVLLLLLEVVILLEEEADMFVGIDDDGEVVEEVDCVVDVLVSLNRLFVVVVVVELELELDCEVLVLVLVLVLLDAVELVLCLWLLLLLLLLNDPLPVCALAQPPPPPLAGGVQRNSVAACSKKSPISDSGDAAVPWHALMIVSVAESRALEQADEQEQRGPFLKCASLQASIGVL